MVLLAQGSCDFADGQLAGGGSVAGGGAGDQLDQAFGGLLADVDAVWDADQVRVLELDPGTLIAVVEQDVESGGFEIAGDLFPGGQQARHRRCW